MLTAGIAMGLGPMVRQLSQAHTGLLLSRHQSPDRIQRSLLKPGQGTPTSKDLGGMELIWAEYMRMGSQEKAKVGRPLPGWQKQHMYMVFLKHKKRPIGCQKGWHYHKSDPWEACVRDTELHCGEPDR
ncbi:hypothetical protein NDU88_005586 [Pleurodeles waltl]|uniref:Uncharacterized protein n=1 Tax=Pleurodeles waltl TaxID=8319 RepID=A0AAV7LLJ5_PLEWA|nr:hypothetical protein NDU88_005586 [Pleurodeles waltl]